ncbi:Fe2+-dependent dioxygenase [Methylotuvimicrobium sp. KM2]|uniref:Fe2+-dependent dioxygenase n=1 Tax=Methylotuvimicrobium sp. KM2 TaxID=3133976 RepID=UPI0031010C89
MDSVFVIKDVLTAEQVASICNSLEQVEFDDGKVTAAGMAKSVKNNQQVMVDKVPDLMPLLSQAIMANPLFNALTMPRAVVNVMLSRYQVGMEYGTHTDAAIMPGGNRADISFTLFLSSPEAYDGGDLVLETALGEQRIRLNAGSLILYPTGELHRVSPVTRGERIVIVGWIQSRIRDSRKRQILLDLENVRKQYLEKVGHDRTAELMLKTSMNLRRMWDE